MPASPRLVRHASESKERALRPATMSAGPSIPRVAISRPRDVVAFFPWVYRVGEQKMDSMCLLYCIAIDGCLSVDRCAASRKTGEESVVSAGRNDIPLSLHDGSDSFRFFFLTEKNSPVDLDAKCRRQAAR